MKKTLALLLYLSISITYAQEVFLDEIKKNISLQDDFHTCFHENENIKNVDTFKKQLNKLTKEKRNDATLVINELAPMISSHFLRAIIYWEIINPDKKLLQRTISSIMFYKALTIRDGLQDPNSSKEYKLFLKNEIKRIYQRGDITEGNIISMLTKDINEKSRMMVNLNTIEEKISAIKETEAITFKISHDEYRPYLLESAGLISGNKIKIFHKNDLSKETLKKGISLKKDPILHKVKEMINQSRESILIDSLLLGENLGEEIINLIIKKTEEIVKENKNFKVLLLSPRKNHYRINSTLNNFKNKIVKHNLQNSIYIIHPPKSFERSVKAIMIDANTNSPQAYLGSKDFITSNGGYNYDYNIWIKGPGAAVIQRMVYESVEEFLQKIPEFKELKKVYNVTKKSYSASGSESIRIAQISKQSHTKSIRDFMIDMIKNSNDHIYMEQRFLIDSHVTNALIKRKLERPKLDIRIILDHNEDLGMNGLPNSIFIKEMKIYGINIRARKTHSITMAGKKIFQINNRKITSVDGKVLILGSADMNQQSLDGNTQMMSIQIFSEQEINRFEKDFLTSWRDREKTVNLDIENFTAIINENNFSKEVSSLINLVSKAFIKMKNEIIRKF